jgi:hypothetical protein
VLPLSEWASESRDIFSDLSEPWPVALDGDHLDKLVAQADSDLPQAGVVARARDVLVV